MKRQSKLLITALATAAAPLWLAQAPLAPKVYLTHQYLPELASDRTVPVNSAINNPRRVDGPTPSIAGTLDDGRQIVVPEQIASKTPVAVSQESLDRTSGETGQQSPCYSINFTGPEVHGKEVAGSASPITETGTTHSAGGGPQRAIASAGSAQEALTPSSLPPSKDGFFGTGQDPIVSRPGNVIEHLREAEAISEQARQQEFVDYAAAAVRANHEAAESDQKTLSEPYRQIPNSALTDYLQRAHENLGHAAEVLDNAVGGMDRSEQARFRNLFLNARDKAALGLDSLEAEKRKNDNFGALSPFAKLSGPTDANPLARTEDLANLFGAQLPKQAAATSQDALVNRLLMQHGLPPEVQKNLGSKLALAEPLKVALPDGRQESLLLLHNGYLLGGGKTAMDCSSFVSSVLPADVRKGRFTTLDFWSMWQFRRLGAMPKPPSNTPEHASLVKQTAMAFDPVNPYKGQSLATGDLLVYRIPSEPIGHVFIVKKYNPVTMVANVFEAAQSAGGLREREFPLTADPPTAKERIVRAGLFALRLKPQNNKACVYRDGAGKRLPASKGGS